MSSSYKPGYMGNVYEIATRAQVVTLKRFTNLTNDQISAITGVNPRQVTKYNSTATEHGNDGGQLLDKHIKDGLRPGGMGIPSRLQD